MGFLQGMAQGATEAAVPKKNPHPPGSDAFYDWEADYGAQVPAGDEIVATAPGKTLDQVQVQVPGFSDLAGPQQKVNVNDPTLVDQRAMIFNAKERRRQAEAEALGQTYEPQYQNEVGKDFKANPKLQFGTRGVARDIIGNAVDFLGGLVGRVPTYRSEKIRDKMYGWDQGPEAQAAAINRVMEYDPEAGQEILKNLTAIESQRESGAATAEYRKSQALPRLLDGISGLSTALISSGNPAAGWQRARPALQSQLDAAYGKDVYKLPEEYDAQTVMGLTRMGYKGATVQREAATILTDETKKLISAAEIAFKNKKLITDDATRRRGQDLVYKASVGNADAARELRKFLEENKLVKTGAVEDIATGTTTNQYSTAGEVRAGRPPVPGARLMNGKWYTRGPNGEAVPVQ